jgi:hypothetical protein
MKLGDVFMDKNLLIFKIKLALAEIVNFPHEKRYKYDKNKNPSEGDADVIDIKNRKKLEVKDDLKSLKNNPSKLKNIENPSEEIQLEAVRQDGFAIKYLKGKNPSEKVQMEAVKQEPRAIGHIKNPSEGIQMEALKKDRFSMNFITNPSEKVQIEFFKSPDFKPNEVKWVQNPSDKALMDALKNDFMVSRYIKNPSKKIKDFIEDLIKNKQYDSKKVLDHIYETEGIKRPV